MTVGTDAASITVRETLELLDGAFAELAVGVAEDRYAFWLGSGISLGRLPGLKLLIRRALNHLQTKIAVGDNTCRFRAALKDALISAAGLSPAEFNALDLDQPITSWVNLNNIIHRLAGNYSRFLEIAVAGEEDDYILWEGADFPNVFADPGLEPDAEHLSIGILILEGVASRIASANWDGLIEKAVDELFPSNEALSVCVLSEDLRQQQRQASLYKFHGCAVRARDDEAKYRPHLVARISQITGWRDKPENAPMVARLVDMAVSHQTIMLGLSVQDANIATIFTQAESQMAWPWPSHPPAYAFSEDRLGVDQKALLKNVYRDNYTAPNRDTIYQSALIRAYAKQLLTSLVLHALWTKLIRLSEMGLAAQTPADRSLVGEGLTHLRDVLASHLGDGKIEDVRKLIAQSNRLMALFYTGDATAARLPYRPLTARPVQFINGDQAIAAAGLRELAVGLALVGRGAQGGNWDVQPVDVSTREDGALRIATPSGALKVIFASSAQAAINLGTNGHVTPGDDVIIVHSQQPYPAMPRSPYFVRGRRGRPGRRDVSIPTLLATHATANDLFDGFREAAGT